MPVKLLLLAVVTLFGLGIFVEAMTLSSQSRSESAAATIDTQALHRQVDVKATPEQRIDDLF
ncbi:MAG TPA: hypothetical protein VFW22_07195 [Pseudolabrys sp.]|nr:hypothetical protein [Pseudolabrys sp.]